MTHPPINAVTWSLAALALYTFCFKSWRTYKLTKNPIAQMYYILGLVFGTAMFFFGVPGLLTRDPHILRYTYFLADFFIQATMQAALWLSWFMGLRNRVKLRYVLACSIPFSLVLLTIEVLTSRVSVSQSPNLIVYMDKPAVLVLKSIIYLVTALPLGYFLLRQVPRQTTLASKMKTFMAGMTFIVVCLAATSNNIFDKGSDTVQSATVVAVFFVIFFFVQLGRPSPHDTGR